MELGYSLGMSFIKKYPTHLCLIKNKNVEKLLEKDLFLLEKWELKITNSVVNLNVRWDNAPILKSERLVFSR